MLVCPLLFDDCVPIPSFAISHVSGFEDFTLSIHSFKHSFIDLSISYTFRPPRGPTSSYSFTPTIRIRVYPSRHLAIPIAAGDQSHYRNIINSFPLDPYFHRIRLSKFLSDFLDHVRKDHHSIATIQ